MVSQVFLSLALLLIALPASAATPAEQATATARASLASGRALEGYLGLAIAHTRRARETGDAAHYARALEALRSVRVLEPDHPRAAKIEAWVQLGLHEFKRAEQIARAHRRDHPDDPETLGVLGDALMELGSYAEAETVYQRMLELRPGPSAYMRGAYWREVAGYPEAALELLWMALAATELRAVEDRAWILVQIGGIEGKLGHPGRADQGLGAALAIFPEYHYALAAKASLALERGHWLESLDWARRALSAAPHAERHLALADALRALGRECEAREAESSFERLALANREQPDNENVYLVDFYLERRPDPERALSIAREEATRRADLGTLDRLARALERNGRFSEAFQVRERGSWPRNSHEDRPEPSNSRSIGRASAGTAPESL